MCGSRDGVDAHIGHGAVTALSLYADRKISRTGSADAAVTYGDCARGQIASGHHMDHQARLGLRVLQKAVAYHILRTLQQLFRALEHEFDGAFQLRFVVFQQLRCAQEHGRVHIMAAGMHIAVGGGEGDIRLLPDGKGVHICPEQENGTAAAHGGGETCLSAVFRSVAKLLQLRPHISQGVFQLEAGLRLFMQGPPMRDQCFADGLSLR